MASYRFLTISLLVICLGFSPIWANPEDPQPNPVETFLQAAETFADTLNTTANFDKTAYLSALTEIRKEVTELPTDDAGYVAADYFKVVADNVKAMADQVQASEHPYKSNIQTEYTEAVANYIKGDCRSIVNQWEATDYSSYYNNLNELYTQRLNTAVSNTKVTRHTFNPLNT